MNTMIVWMLVWSPPTWPVDHTHYATKAACEAVREFKGQNQYSKCISVEVAGVRVVR